MTQKKYSSSLSRQSSETVRTKQKIGLGNPRTFAAYLEFNKPNKQNFYKMFMRLIYFKKSTFLSLKIIVDRLIDIRNETSKKSLLKIN